MEDPENGTKPGNGGASTAGSGAGKPSRRGRRKRKGKSAAAASGVNAGQSQKTAVAGPEPRAADPMDGAKPGQKRKRRRRARKKHPTEIGEAAIHVLSDAVGGAGERKPVPAANADSARPHGKSRRWRGLQGRPLSQKPRAATAHHPVSHPQASDDQPRDHRPQIDQHLARSHGQPVAAQDAPDDLYAALDLGTNNCRLLIAQPTRPGNFRVVDAFSRIVRLGEGLAASGRLSEDAMNRSIEALKICASKLASRNIRKSRLIATEACRAASNGEEFLQRVREETGLDLEIINRETEARLAVSGCSSLVSRETRSVVLFDIGGGSSEIAVIQIKDYRTSRLANHITHWTSLPVGVVTLSERHGGRDVTEDVFAGMVAEVDGMLASFDSPPIHELASSGNMDFHLIGTSGTVTTLAGIHLGLPRYDRRKVDGIWLSDDEVTDMQARLLSWSFAERAANACIGPDRADLVLAGCAILESIRRRWPSSRMRVADRGLREGLLTDMMADDGVWRRMHPRRN